jgi:hypothetical protein
VPIYSSDLSEYNQRVYRNERDTDQEFGTEEFLYRRFPKSSLVNNGWPTPLTFTLEEKSGVSVNRSRYSLPQDVLEPDCCNGNHRPGMVVLEFQVRDLPERIATDGREYLFVPKHVPYECCYAHSEIWCNTSGDINQANEKPSKTIRNLFRARLLVKIQEVGRLPREFPEIATVDR